MSEELVYSGSGTTTYDNGRLKVDGPTEVTVDDRGQVRAEMHVANVSDFEDIQEGLAALSNYAIRAFMSDKSERFVLSVDTKEGVFVTLPGFAQRSYKDVEPGKVVLTFSCMRSMFTSLHQVTPLYWRIPICNFQADLMPNAWTRSFVHTLRLDHLPLTPFTYASKPGFIQSAPGYKEKIAQQQAGDRSPRITALAVGAINGPTANWNEIRSWFPFELIDLFSFANGFRVGFIYVELIDQAGVVASRFHLRAGSNALEYGDSFLDGVLHKGGLGRLIDQAYSSGQLSKPYLRSALRNLVHANRTSLPLEDAMAHISRALDAYAGELGVSTQLLLSAIDSTTRDQVKQSLNVAAQEIERLADAKQLAGDFIAAGSLRRVAERTRTTPANKDRAFGLSVMALMSQLGLNDAQVVASYFNANPRSDGRQWPDVLSYYRGLCQHGDSFDLENEHNPFEVHRLTQHLVDLAARITMKTLNYDGEYQRRNARWSDSKSIDWVKPDTPAVELGYGMDQP